MNFIFKKVSWNELKEKANSGLIIGYEKFNFHYRVFVIRNSIKYFTNIFYPNIPNLSVVKDPNNDEYYQDFVENFKQQIDSNPPVITQSIELHNILKIGDKLQIHSSPKPDTKDKKFYTCWSSRGDDIVNHIMWQGEDLKIQSEPGVYSKFIDIKFDPIFGEVWLHHGYAMWYNAGFGDKLSVFVMAPKVELQTLTNLNLILEGNRVRFSPNGPGTGTHGFANFNFGLVPNKNNTGFWNYSSEQGLTPSLDGTGKYDIYTEDMPILCFMKDILLFGTSDNYFMLGSSDAFKISQPYYIRVIVYNESNTNWQFFGFLTLYREILK